MPRVAIKIGFGIPSEQTINNVGTGVWEETIVEKTIYPEILREYASRSQQSDSAITDLHLASRFSVVMDPFIRDNLKSVRYVTYLSSRWAVDSIEIVYPRVILTIAGLYNGPTPVVPQGG